MYKKCCCYASGQCGPYKRHTLIDEIIKIENLHDDVKNHLINIKVAKSYQNMEQWDEKKLIENRLNQVVDKDDEVCAYHRYNLGVGWKPTKACKHTYHEQHSSKKSAIGRPVPIELTLEIVARYGVTIPIGSMLCSKHLKK